MTFPSLANPAASAAADATAPRVLVVGGGLAGAEAAWQVAASGIPVTLWEMRPERQTPAHHTAFLAELVCSNSLGSLLPDRATGILLDELRLSLIHI